MPELIPDTSTTNTTRLVDTTMNIPGWQNLAIAMAGGANFTSPNNTVNNRLLKKTCSDNMDYKQPRVVGDITRLQPSLHTTEVASQGHGVKRKGFGTVRDKTPSVRLYLKKETGQQCTSTRPLGEGEDACTVGPIRKYAS